MQALSNAFNEKKKQGLVQSHGSGYGGSGFKFDTSEQVSAGFPLRLPLIRSRRGLRILWLWQDPDLGQTDIYVQDQYKQARKAQAKELGLGGGEEEEEEEDQGVRRVDGTSQASTTGKAGEATVAGATISAEAMAAMMSAAAASSTTQQPGTTATPGQQAHIVAAQAVAARLVAGGVGGFSLGPSTSMLPPPPPGLNTAMLQAMQSIPGVTLTPGVSHTSITAF